MKYGFLKVSALGFGLLAGCGPAEDAAHGALGLPLELREPTASPEDEGALSEERVPDTERSPEDERALEEGGDPWDERDGEFDSPHTERQVPEFDVELNRVQFPIC